MPDYVRRFEMIVDNESPHKLIDEERRRILWQEVLEYVRQHTDFHCKDYIRLRSVVLRAEQEWMQLRSRQ